MPLVRPNFDSIFASLFTDVHTGIGNQPVADQSILNIFTYALAKGIDEVYGYVDNTYLNAVPWTARSSSQDAWAACLGGVLRQAPASASGSATFTFNAAATIPAGSTFIGGNQVSYTSTANVVANSAGSYTVPLLTTTTGSVTNMQAGATVTLTAPIANVVAAGTVLEMTGGFDAQSDSSLFNEAQQVRSNPRQGGAASDYVGWALASGDNVTRAWVQETPNQAGLVALFIMCDENANNGFPIGSNGTATQDTRGSAAVGDQLQVANFVYAPYRRPVTAFVNVLAPVAQPIAITINNTNPNTSASQAAVIAALNARLLEIGSPLGQVIQQSDLTQAIQSVLTSFDMSVPSGSTSVTLGNLPTVGTVTFT